MNIFSSEDFSKLVGEYDPKWLLEIIKLYDIEFATINVMYLESVYEACLTECVDYTWDTNNVTVIYNKTKVYSFYDAIIKCAILNIEGSKFIDLFIRTKNMKAFL